MHTFVAVLLLSLIALPAVIWFARDALVARLNPWVWAVGGFLSVALPPFLLFRLGGLLSERGLFPKVQMPWGGIIGVSIIAVGWFTAYVIHKRVLKPKRIATIGNSLNYVGGWLGFLIYMLLLTAGLILVTYGRDTYKTLEQLCPGEQMRETLFRCIIASAPAALDTVARSISVAGCLWAAIAIIRKTASAIRITGWVLLWFIMLGILQYVLDVTVNDASRSTVTRGQQVNEASMPIWSIVWLGYLMRSRRVREVYGRNFGRSNESSAGGMPT